MNKVGYVYHPVYLEHDTGDHPENAGRLEAIMDYLTKTGEINKLIAVPARPATVEEIGKIHTLEHIKAVQKMAEQGGGHFDLDTPVSPRSFEAALYAAGGSINAVEAVMKGEVESAFALVRPPGHHSTRDLSMGFCPFNNIAIAATVLLEKFNLQRVLIVDLDVHHGNGTQEAFYREPRVSYVSTHQHPFYPGTGDEPETGSGDARGHIVNIPLPAGCGDEEYFDTYREIVIPVIRRFKPEFILVSVGYDAFWGDQLGSLKLTVTGFAALTKGIKSLADEFCAGRMALFLEGGYNPSALAVCVKATFDVLLGNRVEDPLGAPKVKSKIEIGNLLREIKRIHHLI